MDRGWKVWLPPPHQSVMLSCAACMTGPLAQRADEKAALRDFLWGNVFSLLVLKNNRHYRPGEVIAVSQHFGCVHCQMGYMTE